VTNYINQFQSLQRWAKNDVFELLLPTISSAAPPTSGIGKRPYYRRGLHLANFALLDDLHGKPHIIAFWVKGHSSLKAMFEYFAQPASKQPFEGSA
jgi:hypothetical protein